MLVVLLIKIAFSILLVVACIDAFRPPQKISFCLAVVGVGACTCVAIWFLEIKTDAEKAILLGVIGILVASYIARIIEGRKERIQAKIPS